MKFYQEEICVALGPPGTRTHGQAARHGRYNNGWDFGIEYRPYNED
jgi:hypothetical protein